MLPHARTGGIAGLLEMIDESPNGREDIYRLADQLSFEIDDLLPIVEAAALLGFLKVDGGRRARSRPRATSLPTPTSCARRSSSARPLSTT